MKYMQGIDSALTHNFKTPAKVNATSYISYLNWHEVIYIVCLIKLHIKQTVVSLPLDPSSLDKPGFFPPLPAFTFPLFQLLNLLSNFNTKTITYPVVFIICPFTSIDHCV